MDRTVGYSIRRTGSYLMHYGISGQKRGVRRYQNDDGTLTEEGKARYAGMKNYGANESKGLIRRQAEKSHGMTRAFAEWREGRHKKNLAKAERKGNEKKIEKYRSKRDAQSAANSDLQAYRDHSNTAKLLLRSAAYEHARARGTGRLGSLVEAGTPIGGLLRMHRDKKKYGKRIVYSGINEREYDAMAMDRD